MTEKTVGKTTFQVPERHSVQDYAGMTPQAQTKGLTFVLNPDAPSSEHIFVGVDAAAEVCADAAGAVVDMVPRACAVAEGKAAAVPIGTLVRAERVAGISSQWDYKGPDGGVVAACSRSSRGGSCNASFAWRDLIYTISLDDAQIGDLSGFRTKVDDLLEAWVAS